MLGYNKPYQKPTSKNCFKTFTYLLFISHNGDKENKFERRVSKNMSDYHPKGFSDQDFSKEHLIICGLPKSRWLKHFCRLIFKLFYHKTYD